MPARPCDVCRKRKQKCLLQPNASACTTCINLGHSKCTYDEPPPRKRRATESEDAATAGSVISAVNSSALHRRSSYSDQVLSPASSVSFDYPQESLLRQTLGLEKSRFSEFISPAGEHDAFVLQRQGHPEPAGKQRQQHIRRVQTGVLFQMTPDAPGPPTTDVDSIEEKVRPHGPALVALYFRIVHPSFPILHKDVFLEKYRRAYREITPHLLAAVYAIAIKWWAYDDNLLLQPRLDEAALVDAAHSAVRESFTRPRLNTIQAGLLLLQRHRGPLAHRDAAPAALAAGLVAVAHFLGLHLDCSTWDIPPWEKGLRRRLAWALYLNETLAAMTAGTPRLISLGDEWLMQPLCLEDFIEDSETTTQHQQNPTSLPHDNTTTPSDSSTTGSADIHDGRLLFIELVKLARVAGDIQSTLYSTRALQSNRSPSAVLSAAKPLGRALVDLLRNLPASLRLERVQPSCLCANGFYHLAHHAVTASLHRRLLWSVQRSASPYSSDEVVDDAFARFVRDSQSDRADALVAFVSRLAPEHMEAFWPAAAGGCCVALGCFLSLLRVTSRDEEEAARVRGCMKAFEWQLRVKANSGEWIAYALTRLRALGWEEWRDGEVVFDVGGDGQEDDVADVEGIEGVEGLADVSTPADVVSEVDYVDTADFGLDVIANSVGEFL